MNKIVFIKSYFKKKKFNEFDYWNEVYLCCFHQPFVHRNNIQKYDIDIYNANKSFLLKFFGYWFIEYTKSRYFTYTWRAISTFKIQSLKLCHIDSGPCGTLSLTFHPSRSQLWNWISISKTLFILHIHVISIKNQQKSYDILEHT